MADKIAKNATIRHKSDLTVSFSKTDIKNIIKQRWKESLKKKTTFLNTDCWDLVNIQN